MSFFIFIRNPNARNHDEQQLNILPLNKFYMSRCFFLKNINEATPNETEVDKSLV